MSVQTFRLVATIQVDSDDAYDLALEYAFSLTDDAPIGIEFVSGPNVLNLDDSELEEDDE